VESGVYQAGSEYGVDICVVVRLLREKWGFFFLDNFRVLFFLAIEAGVQGGV
jgi:hypothetical protein